MTDEQVAKELLKTAKSLLSGPEKQASFADNTPFQDALGDAYKQALRGIGDAGKNRGLLKALKDAQRAAESADKILQQLWMREYTQDAG